MRWEQQQQRLQVKYYKLCDGNMCASIPKRGCFLAYI